MKITGIKKEHLDLFADMDPLEYLERADFPDRICLGAFLEDEETGTDDPAGLMILRKSEDSLTVEWICVRAKYRYRGVGSSLMDHAYEMADDMGFKKLQIYLNSDYGRDEICPGEEDFVEEFNIEDSEELYGEWIAETRDLSKLDFMESEDVPEMSCHSLIEMDARRVKEFLGKQNENEDSAFLYNPKNAGARILDDDTSMFLVRDGKISGAVLSQMCGETLFVVGFLANSKSEAKMLLKHFVKSVGRKYGARQEIRVIKYTDLYNEISKDILHIGKIENRMYISDVEKHFVAKERFVPEFDDVLISDAF